MGQSQSKSDTSSITFPSNGARAPPAPVTDTLETDALLEKNYAAYYSSDTFNNISAAAASFTPTHPTRPQAGPTSQFSALAPDVGITAPAPPSHLRRISELIDPNDLAGSTSLHSLDVYDPYRTGLTPDTSPQKRKNLTDAEKNKRLPALVQSPSGNIFGAKEFAVHPNRPLAMRERQEGIKAALARAQANPVSRGLVNANPIPVPEKEKNVGMRKGSGGSTSSAGTTRTVDSGISFESFGHSKGKNANLGDWESRKIEEGRRMYEEKQARKEEKPKKKGFLCFK